MHPSYKRKSRPKLDEELYSLFVNGGVSNAPEILEYMYKKEFGLTTAEFMQEPVDRVKIFTRIKQYEAKRNEIEQRKAQQKDG